jgi:hypothetical protein
MLLPVPHGRVARPVLKIADVDLQLPVIGLHTIAQGADIAARSKSLQRGHFSPGQYRAPPQTFLRFISSVE